jgi:hypothetical protein
MRYYTKALYERIQEGAFPERLIVEYYNNAAREYHDYLDGIRCKLTNDVQQLAECYLHDYHISKVINTLEEKTLYLELDHESKRHPKRTTLLFHAVNDTENVKDIEGCYMLYHEIVVEEDDSFVFSALLDKISNRLEVSFGFKSVQVRTMDRADIGGY